MSGVEATVLQALGSRADIASKVQSYRVEGRTKELVSTFRKARTMNITPLRRFLCIEYSSLMASFFFFFFIMYYERQPRGRRLSRP